MFSINVKYRSSVKRFLAIVLISLFGAGMLQAGQAKPKKHDSRHEIYDLENAWRDAVINSDTNAMGALLAEDYMSITASGMLQTKQQVLANLRNRRVRITTLLLSDRKVRFYGGTAVVTSIAEVKGTNAEGDMSGSFRYTRVYVRDAQGKWRIVSFESSKIRTAEERKKLEQGADTQ